jgi:hypothetical protein
LLTVSSFLVFWMDPSVGERLGFGITLVLTVYFIQARLGVAAAVALALA